MKLVLFYPGADVCFTVSDNGEGQTPDKMPYTLLSLDRSNKLRVPFVQGKFNMGHLRVAVLRPSQPSAESGGSSSFAGRIQGLAQAHNGRFKSSRGRAS
jgi:hypothetical protein